ncbi:MAG: 4-(cytidine 5'-diphospho)-2-C-methyl-D-erythritol kinase [Gemmatimonadota bacterium]
MSGSVSVLAPAKLNLVLRVLGRRPDGYHEIDTLFQAVDLHDDVVVELIGEGIELEVDGPDLGPVQGNLAHRAARALIAEAGVDTGVRIRLSKRIPVGAGLGGGSSDAAAVLVGLGKLLGGVEPVVLRSVAATLGSDVPFFLGDSPLARGTGRGEVLEPLEPLPVADFVLVSPPVHVSTAGAYAALAEVRAGERTKMSAEASLRLEAWDGLADLAENDFEPVISAAHPEIGRSLSALRYAGARVELMSGSGSTCFGLFGGRSEAAAAAARLTDQLGWECSAVRSLASFSEPTLE